MKAISLWQPWSSLWIVNPRIKIYETRSWGTSYRGPLLVHAAKKNDREIREAIEDFPDDLKRMFNVTANFDWDKLPFGAIIGRVELTQCRLMNENNLASVSRMEMLCGNWETGRFAWRGEDPVTFREPIPYKGMQKLFDVPDSFLKQVDLG